MCAMTTVEGHMVWLEEGHIIIIEDKDLKDFD